MYGVQWRSWPTPDGGHIDQIAAGRQDAQDQPRFAPHHRERLERGRALEDGADALPRASSSSTWHRRRPTVNAASSAASSTSAAPTSSWACPSTSRATRCSRTWSRSSATSYVGDFIWTGGDCHIYSNHAEQVAAAAEPHALPLPHAEHQAQAALRSSTTSTRTSKSLDYRHHEAIKAPVAV